MSFYGDGKHNTGEEHIDSPRIEREDLVWYQAWRHQEGISLNPRECLLDDDNNVLHFNTKRECLDFLNLRMGLEIPDIETLAEEYGIHIELATNPDYVVLLSCDYGRMANSYETDDTATSFLHDWASRDNMNQVVELFTNFVDGVCGDILDTENMLWQVSTGE